MLLLPIAGNAQGMYDALRFSKQHYDGTARSLSMGNAFTALGGDMGAIPINPASSGVYRYSEFVITPAIDNSIDKTMYLSNLSTQNYTRFGLSNIGWVGSFSTGRKSGLLNFNFAVTINRTNDYTSRTSAYGEEANTSWLASVAATMPSNISGYDLDMPSSDPDAPFYNTGAPWRSILAWNTLLLDTLGSSYSFAGATENEFIDKDGERTLYIGGPLKQNFYRQTYGSSEDITLNFGGNVSDKLFFGVNFTVQNLWYSYHESYSETAIDPKNFETRFENFEHSFDQYTTGYGFNIKAGVIYRPIKGLRLGGAISTPTWLRLSDRWSESITAQFTDKNLSAKSPYGAYDYRITTPFRWNIGLAYTFGKFALVSVDYENANYSSIVMADSYGNTKDFSETNQDIKTYFRSTNNIRAGVEVKVVPQFAIRAGYNYYDKAEKNFKDQMHLASLGVGYASKGGFFVDLAYQQQINYTRETYSLYQEYLDTDNPTVPIMDSKYLKWKLLLSLGFKF